MAMAMVYLYKYRDADVQAYLCERMLHFPESDVEFYLPQLLALCIQGADTPEQCEGAGPVTSQGGVGPYAALRQHILTRCSLSLQFALLTHWLLDSERTNPSLTAKKHRVIAALHEDLQRVQPTFPVVSEGKSQRRSTGTHRRTKSDVTTPTKNRLPVIHSRSQSTTGDDDESLKATHPNSRSFNSISTLGTGHAFDLHGEEEAEPASPLHSGHTHSLQKSSSNPQLSSCPSCPTPSSDCTHGGLAREDSMSSSVVTFGEDSEVSPSPIDDKPATLKMCMAAEQAFVQALQNIGSRLTRFPTKDVRRTQLHAELSLLNLNLPARVYLPLNIGGSGDEKVQQTHHVVRIPPREAVILNSKDRVPYLIQVEVLDCSDLHTSALPRKLTLDKRHMRTGSDGQIDPVQEEDAIEAATPAVPLEAAADSAAESGVLRPGDIRRRLSIASSDPHSRFARESADPSAVRAKEPWAEKVSRIRRHSPYGHLPNWRLIPVIIKSGDDLRQELLASQLLSLFQTTWQEEMLALWLRPIRILVTSASGGMIEVIGSAVSLHQTRKSPTDTLASYFSHEYGDSTSDRFLTAQKNFVQSLAAYSLFCYFVQVKDRHNGNILIDSEGHVIHIDFGYILSNSPRNLGFENAPFKLTHEFIEVLGGVESDMFKYYKILILQGFIAARKHRERFITLVEIMERDSKLPCFVKGRATVSEFADRFQMTLTEQQLTDHVEQLIQSSIDSMRTVLYDGYQYYTNGIL